MSKCAICDVLHLYTHTHTIAHVHTYTHIIYNHQADVWYICYIHITPPPPKERASCFAGQ